MSGALAGEDRPRFRDVLTIAAAGLLINIVLIAIPGFYSHDELQWRIEIERHDFPWSFHLGNILTSPFFRLSGAMFISLSLRLPLQPFAAHFCEALIGVATACLLYLTAALFAAPRRALAAAILFMLAPGYAYGAGWVAAGFDVQYAFWGVASALAAILYWRGRSPLYLLLSVAAFLVALGCKETALAIPVCVAIVAFVDRERAARSRLVVLFCATAALAAIYLALRARAILSVGLADDGGYSFGGAAQLASNLLAYFGFPFTFDMLEISPFPAGNLLDAILAAGPHLILLALILWRGGPAGALLYLSAFYATVLPVLPISKFETQYTYASSIALALALALTWDRRLLAALPVAALCLLLAFHGFAIQGRMYETGVCQTRAIAALHALVPALAPSKPLNVLIDDDGPWWVIARAVNQKYAFPLNGGFVQVSVTRNTDEATMVFHADCSVTLAGSP